MMHIRRVLCVGAAFALLGTLGCRAVERQLEPTPPSLRELREANRLMKGEHYDQAAVAYRSWLANYGTHPDDAAVPLALFQLGRCYWHMRDYPRAVTAFETLKTRYGDSPDPAIQKAVRAAELGLEDIEKQTGHSPARPDNGDWQF